MPNVVSGGVRPGDFILGEDDRIGARSRDNLTVVPSIVLQPGEVCGIVTANGRVAKLNPAGSDGSDDAACISIYKVDSASGAVMAVFITRDATVKEDGLIWPAGISAPNKAAAIAQLAERGIIIRPRSYVG